jgi:O-antigen/teichoic acid export membrane protein
MLGSSLRSRVIWRRSATAVGAYVAAVLGFLTTVVATRELGLHDYARFAAVIAASTFFQQLLDLTIEEALVKYGFRYAEAGRWGRLRRLFELALGFKVLGGVLAGLALIALAPFAKTVWGAGGVLVPMLIAATIALAQAPENVAAGAIILRGRYDIRGAFLAVSMALRLVGLAIGCRYGITGGVIGMAAAQAAATAAIGIAGLAAFRRFPRVPAEPLGEDSRELRRFLVSSTLSSSLDSARATLGTALVPTVAPIAQTAYFRNAQAPATGLAALSGPVRLVMLTEQTRDFEAGRHGQVYGMLRRYVVGTAVLMLVAVPLLWWLMPFLIGLAYTHVYRVHATEAARLVLVVGALRLVWAWTKSFPVSIGRPGLRVVVQSIEIAVFVPVLLVFAARWGATGAAGAMLVSTGVFCAVWTVVLFRLRDGWRAAEAAVN